MICPQCQEVTSDTARFCPNCGVSFSSFNKPVEPGEAAALPETLRDLDPLAGQVLDGKYELLARLGEGGMGAVYRARRIHIGDEVAVKVLLRMFVTDAGLVERFRREARAAAMLRHPNVVAIYDYGEARDADAPAYIVMELVEGTSLRQVLLDEGRLTPERALLLMRDICAGVGAAHRRQVFHRDLKPDNVIVLPADEDRERETVKVVDFGLAKLRDVAGAPTLTQTGTVMGTPHYMSPEQCQGEPLDARSDVYSLGAMLYEMLAGAPPFTAKSPLGVIAEHVTELPPPLPDEAGVPAPLAAVIMRALAKSPDERPADATLFLRELRAAEEEAGREREAAARREKEESERRRREEQAARAAEEARRRKEAEEQQRREAEAQRQRAKQEEQRRREAEEAARRGREAEEVERQRVAEREAAQAKVKAARAAAELPSASVEGAGYPASPLPGSGAPPTQSRRTMLVIVAALVVCVIGVVAAKLLISGSGAAVGNTNAVTANTAAVNQSQPGQPPGNSPAAPTGMVYVPGGDFMMRRDYGDMYERPAHRVTVRPFFIDVNEVTREEYARFVKATGHRAPPGWANGSFPAGTARLPVTGVTWDDAVAYARWAGKRLPTEEEWEFAARGSEGFRYPWGNDWGVGLANVDAEQRGLAEVGAFAGKSPFGAVDMVGNAWEWTASNLTAYPGGQLPKQPAADLKVIRGGSYVESKDEATTTYRRGYPARGEYDYSNTGFRCAKDITNPPASQ